MAVYNHGKMVMYNGGRILCNSGKKASTKG